MHAVETVPANGRVTIFRRPDGLLVELVRLRAVCRRQRVAIDKLSEDVAMFRGAVAALTVQNTALREAAASGATTPPTGQAGRRGNGRTALAQR